MKTSKSAAIYQIKVTLLYTKPPIWRRLLVPGEMTLNTLHDVIQATMEWEDSHLHEFAIGKKRFGIPDPSDGFLDDSDCRDERQVRVSSVLGRAGAQAIYSYDFGDGWEHSIVVEKVLPRDETVAYPVCTAGKRCGPVEDCGGPGGFYRMLRVLENPDHEEYEEMTGYLGEGYDPAYFSLDEMNERLARFRDYSAKAATVN